MAAFGNVKWEAGAVEYQRCLRDEWRGLLAGMNVPVCYLAGGAGVHDVVLNNDIFLSFITGFGVCEKPVSGAGEMAAIAAPTVLRTTSRC